MVAYRDFVPRPLPAAGWFPKRQTWETFDDALAAANSWIVGESVKVVTVETVVLPNIARAGEPRTKDAEYETWGMSSAPLIGRPFWYQFVRVWYEK